MKVILKALVICTVTFVAFGYKAKADIKLPKLVSDGMVLQRDTKVKIWGWADAGEEIKVQFNQLVFETVASESGNWSVLLPQQKAGGPFEMKVSGKNKIQIKNILFGDVWLCSGQSNMETTLSRVAPLYEEEIATCTNAEIRLFQVPVRWNFRSPQNDIQGGKWEEANPQNILKYTAVGYFFARGLYEKYKIPVGIIQCAAGGSAAESWISEEALKSFPEQYNIAKQFADSAFLSDLLSHEHIAGKKWSDEIAGKDRGNQQWRMLNYDDSEWPVFELPGDFKTQTGFESGIIWLRKEINLPDNCEGKSAYLEMGRIVDSDSVFINGSFVGSVSYQYPPRRYNVGAGILKAGKNVIVAKVISQSANGGFIKDKPYQITIAGDKYDLKGNWKYKVGATAAVAPVSTFLPAKPLGLFNAMLYPISNYTIKGVAWYQGETNTERPAGYAKVLAALIAEWRSLWDNPKLPFLCVQLPEFMEEKVEPAESDWAILRNEQRKIRAVSNTALVVTLGLGEWNDIHPLRKKEVGERLLLAALKNVYDDKNIVASGPMYQSMRINGNKIEISFKKDGHKLTTSDGKKPKYFAIAGNDQKFVWAEAEISNNKVIVWSEKVPNPAFVRYAWADNPRGANLCNSKGLPASPFSTE